MQVEFQKRGRKMNPGCENSMEMDQSKGGGDCGSGKDAQQNGSAHAERQQNDQHQQAKYAGQG